MARRSKPRGHDPVKMDRGTSRTVYIASPYTSGPCADNVAVQIDAFHRLLDLGFAPFAPLLSHFAELHRRRPYDEWIYDWCIPWVERCDLILRLPGTSKGADIEVQHALKHGIEVYFGWEDLKSSI